ncbi:ABC transporter permease [Actinomyces mediterranea]|uniref:ABC transporter permease n=1 Tax=Actinomyces mediterranea TaxID=1871028 RepID=UPI00097058B9|nr:ABC transporter permease subunit [Actinomyces mediterranea]
MTWLNQNWGLIAELTLTHLSIALPAILASIALAIPLGWWAQRSKRAGGALLTGLSVLYAIPSLPMLIAIPVIVGVALRSNLNMIIVLTVYGVAVLVRQVAEAFTAVPSAVLESADAAGFAPMRRFWTVELPLALPVIVAGVRVVIVSTVSLVTVGAFIGVRSLGTLFTDGFQRGLVSEVVCGLVATVLLALALDLIAIGVGYAATPWTRVRAEADSISRSPVTGAVA